MGGQSIPDSACGLRGDGIARVCAATHTVVPNARIEQYNDAD